MGPLVLSLSGAYLGDFLFLFSLGRNVEAAVLRSSMQHFANARVLPAVPFKQTNFKPSESSLSRNMVDMMNNQQPFLTLK